jgi:hypothetical protein
MSFDLEEITEKSRKLVARYPYNYECYFELFRENGFKSGDLEGSACYGDVWEYLDEGYEENTTHLVIYTPGTFYDDVWWYDYVVNRSPFRDVFITKDPNSRAIEINLNRPWTEILAGLVFHRRPRECTKKHIKKFFEAGLTEMEVFVLSEFINFSVTNRSRVYFEDPDGDHSIIPYKGVYEKVFDYKGFINTDKFDFKKAGFQDPYHWYNRGIQTFFLRNYQTDCGKGIRDKIYTMLGEDAKPLKNILPRLVEIMKGI